MELLISIFLCLLVNQMEAMQFCPKSRPSPNSTVHFINTSDLVPEVNGCIKQYLTMRCCMADYVTVRWFQKLNNGTWIDFLQFKREYGPNDNQTAILKSPFTGIDDGPFKCVGHSTVSTTGFSLTIEHLVNVKLKSCPDLHDSPPFPFLPERDNFRVPCNTSGRAILKCGAVFGTECEPGRWCRFQWTKTGKRELIPEGSSTSGLRVYYEYSGTASNINDMTSALHITHVTESDFGTYVCVMQNKYGHVRRKIILAKNEDLKKESVVLMIVIVVGSITLLLLLFCIVAYKHRWELHIRWNEMKQRCCSSSLEVEDVKYDVLLLHTSSSSLDKDFSKYCRQRLEKLQYRVANEIDIRSNKDTISEWLRISDMSRYVVVILSANFLTDQEQTARLPLQNIIRNKVDILFLLFQVSLRPATDWPFRSNDSRFVLHGCADGRRSVSDDLWAAVKTKAKVAWPIVLENHVGASDGVDWERLEDDSVNRFWEELRHQLPSPRHAPTDPRETDPLLEVKA